MIYIRIFFQQKESVEFKIVVIEVDGDYEIQQLEIMRSFICNKLQNTMELLGYAANNFANVCFERVGDDKEFDNLLLNYGITENIHAQSLFSVIDYNDYYRIQCKTNDSVIETTNKVENHIINLYDSNNEDVADFLLYSFCFMSAYASILYIGVPNSSIEAILQSLIFAFAVQKINQYSLL